MPQPYIPPGVTVTQVNNPATQPTLGQPTVVCLVGPAQGYFAKVDIVQLLDDVAATLSASDGIDLNSIVVTSLDGQTTYVQGTATGNTGNATGRPSGDYYIDGNQIVRSMQTKIPYNTQVLVYYEVDSGSGVVPNQNLVTLVDSTPVTLAAQGTAGTTKIQNYAVQGVGVVPSSDYTVSYGVTRTVTDGVTTNNSTTLTSATASFTSADQGGVISGAGIPANTTISSVTNSTTVVLSQNATATATGVSVSITPQSSITAVTGGSSIFPTSTKQTVYIDYNDHLGTRHYAVPIALNGTTAVKIAGTVLDTGPDSGNSGSNANLVVKNVAVNTISSIAVLYQSTSDSTALQTPGSSCDYTITGNGATPQTYSIFRPAGTVTLSVIPSGATVKVSYNATPSTYWNPTVCFSQTDVENIYGPAFDNLGNVSSPLSLASLFAFAQGAPSLILQAVFHQTSVNGVLVNTAGGNSTAAGSDGANLADWTSTLVNLRSAPDVNVIVPVVNAAGTPSDNLALTVFEAVQDHIAFMRDQETPPQYIVGLCGEDSTVGTNLAQESVLQNHATVLGARKYAETISLVSPASFQYMNPVTGAVATVGGQYVAAMLSGLLAANAIQQPLTRQTVPSLVNVLDPRTTAQKNQDAASGLLVVENVSTTGIVRVRHALTTAVSDPNGSELSVVRSKGFVIETVQQSLDNTVIGQILADSNAPTIVQSVVTNALDALQSQGVIDSYGSVQAAISTSNPTAIDVRFAYTPKYPLNYINVSFSLSTVTQTVQNVSTT